MKYTVTYCNVFFEVIHMLQYGNIFTGNVLACHMLKQLQYLFWLHFMILCVYVFVYGIVCTCVSELFR